MFRRVRSYLIAIFLLVTGCLESKLSTQTAQSVSDPTYYLLDSTDVRVYWRDTDFGTFVTQLAPQTGRLKLPQSVRNHGDYSNRDDANEPEPLDVIAIAYRSDHPSGDFYFEAPLLGPETTISNVTTALSWYLQFGFGSEHVRVSQKTFDKLVLTIEVFCTACRTKSNSEVLQLLLNDANLNQQIRKSIASENPLLNLDGKVWSDPAPRWAWSTPIMTIHGVGLKTLNELDTISLQTLFVDVRNSRVPITPQSWTHTAGASVTTVAGGAPLNYLFNQNDSGTHYFQPTFNAPVVSAGMQYVFTVGNVNRLPMCGVNQEIIMRANRFNSTTLAPLCTDADIEDTNLTYSLQSGPPNLTINTAGFAKWTPPQAAGNLEYRVPLNFSVNDSHNGIASGTAQIVVQPDHLPTFTNVQSTYAFTEGVESTITLAATDSDGDPLVLSILPVTPLQSGFPTGAGVFQIVRAGTAGNYTFTVTYTPSFLQAIGANGTVQVLMQLSYEPNLGLNSALNFDMRTVDIGITNVDDPPSWTTQPGDLLAIENVDLAGAAGGFAEDSPLNPTSITYSLVSLGNPNCAWPDVFVQKEADGSATLHGPPDYIAEANCNFNIRASDAKGLYSDSALFTISADNVNRPITAKAPQTFTGAEGKILSIDLSQLFDDPDRTENDPREDFVYECTVDLDHDAIYETSCASANVMITTRNDGWGAAWTPAAQTAGTYAVEMKITDIGGAVAVGHMTIIVNASASPMLLTASLGAGPDDTLFTVSEATNYVVMLHARSASARPIDAYNFYLNPPTCAIANSASTCSATFLTSPGTMTGSGDDDFAFSLKPSFSDGNTQDPTKNSVKYLLTFNLEKEGDPSTFTTLTVQVTVENTNRAPTAINIGKGTFGCSGSAPNSDPSFFSICVDASADTKSGGKWSKSYVVPLNAIDLDTTNDAYAFNFAEPLVPGKITVDPSWTFSLPSCVSAGTGSISRVYNLTASDGRGGTVDREIRVKILKASANSNCL